MPLRQGCEQQQGWYRDVITSAIISFSTLTRSLFVCRYPSLHLPLLCLASVREPLSPLMIGCTCVKPKHMMSGTCSVKKKSW